MKIFKRCLIGLAIALAALLAGGALFVALSPMPAVLLLRHGFSDATVNLPEGYAQRAAEVRVEHDLVYPSADGRNTFDVYLPAGADAETELPTIVWAHGGAFVAGDKSGLEIWATMLASEGYAVVAPNYEWAPEIAYPGQVRQVEECLQEIARLAEAGAYPFDMDRIVLAGDSAGAHIAAQAGLLATNPAYEEAIGVESALDAAQLKGMLLYCGPYNVEKIMSVDNGLIQFFASRIGWALFGTPDWQDGTLIATTTIGDYVTDAFPPTFVTDGNSGSFEREGKELVGILEDHGVEVTSLFFPIDEHGEIGHEYQGDLTTPEGQAAYEETLALLERALG